MLIIQKRGFEPAIYRAFSPRKIGVVYRIGRVLNVLSLLEQQGRFAASFAAAIDELPAAAAHEEQLAEARETRSRQGNTAVPKHPP